MSQRDVTYNGETVEAVMVGTYTLEMHYDPPMKVSEIRAGAEDVNMLERRILGRADGLNEDFDGAAKEFTEIVKWDISALSAEDLAVWMEVASNLRFCSAVTEEWADAVSGYKRERRRVVDRWNAEAPAHEADLEKTEAAFRFVGQETPAQKAGAALRALADELEGEEATAYANLDSVSVDLLQDLRNGPTPAAVQRLIENGYITWSYFNLGGDVEAAPIDISPEEAAEDFSDFIDAPRGYEGDVTEVTAIINNLALVAAAKQQSGGNMEREHLEFLSDFYDHLEQNGTNMEYPGVLGVAIQASHGTDIPEDLKENLLGTLGNGLLVLSDESIGGSYHSLPESVIAAVEGPGIEEHYDLFDWQPHISIFSEMMNFSDSGLRGGEQFSVNLTQTIAGQLDDWDTENDDPEGINKPLTIDLVDAQHLIQVSSRNENANHAIITGEGDYAHPLYGLDPEMTFRGLYRQDWPDDGSAVGAMTDWIWEQAGDENEEMRGEALVEFVDLFSDPEFGSAISGTGHSMEGTTLNKNGKEVDVVWNDVSAGQLNPNLAWAWSELFTTYIDAFASENGTPLGDEVSTFDESGYHPGTGVVLMTDSRSAFLEQAMGDENSAAHIYANMVRFGNESLNDFPDYRDNSGLGIISTGDAAQAGILRGLVDAALIDEAAARTTNSTQANAHINKVTGYGIDMAGSVFSEMNFPGSGVVAEGFKIFTKEHFNIEDHPMTPRLVEEYEPWHIIETTQARILQEIVENDPNTGRDLESLAPGLVSQDSNGAYYISLDGFENDATRNDSFRDAWQYVQDNAELENGISPDSALETYTQAYDNAREKI
ncbi:TPR repeat region-containing protein [Nocardiopsis flavescens]